MCAVRHVPVESLALRDPCVLSARWASPVRACVVGAFVTAAVLVGGLGPDLAAAHAGEFRGGAPREFIGPRHGGMVVDRRFGVEHYYPQPGAWVGTVPSGAMPVLHHGSRWYFHGGVWFRPSGPRYIVGMPPLGIVIPILPAVATTVWIGPTAYYYANGVYYSPVPGGYAVVASPLGVEAARVEVPTAPNLPTGPAPAAGSVVAPAGAASAPVGTLPVAIPASVAPVEPIIYPRQAQTAVQMQQDRQECNQWAAQQQGAQSDPSIFGRGFSACMDARGYTVR